MSELYRLGDPASIHTCQKKCVWHDDGWVELNRAEDAERYARLGRAAEALFEMWERGSGDWASHAQWSGMGLLPVKAGVYDELADALRAIEEADSEGII